MTPAVESLPLALRFEFTGLSEALRWRMQHGLLVRAPEAVEAVLRMWLKSRGIKRPATAVTTALAKEILGGAP